MSRIKGIEVRYKNMQIKSKRDQNDTNDDGNLDRSESLRGVESLDDGLSMLAMPWMSSN